MISLAYIWYNKWVCILTYLDGESWIVAAAFGLEHILLYTLSFFPIILKKIGGTLINQEKMQDIALMRYSTIAPLISGLHEDYASLDAFFRTTSLKGVTAPDGTLRHNSFYQS